MLYIYKLKFVVFQCQEPNVGIVLRLVHYTVRMHSGFSH